jgi:3-phosphoshikimate 1-carboxyvinyltransferase
MVPSSKSVAHREIIAARLSAVEGPVVRGESNDTLATRRCLDAMMSGESVWPCGESGSTLRFLAPIAGVMGWKGEFECEGRLGDRPRMPFERKDVYRVAGNVSSQFVSGLLMALPLAEWDSEIVVDGKLESSAYVDLTEDVLVASGIRFEKLPGRWRIPGRQRYRIAPRREVEGDWSQAAFFLAMGVGVEGLDLSSKQGDRAVVRLLDERLVDAAPVPDLIPALAAHAALREGQTRFVNCGRLRLKESDRLVSTAEMVNSVGGRARIEGDGIVVDGAGGVRGGAVRTCSDHRIAMAAAVLATGSDGPVVVDDAGAVAKSYPGFWDDFDNLKRM